MSQYLLWTITASSEDMSGPDTRAAGGKPGHNLKCRHYILKILEFGRCKLQRKKWYVLEMWMLICWSFSSCRHWLLSALSSQPWTETGVPREIRMSCRHRLHLAGFVLCLAHRDISTMYVNIAFPNAKLHVRLEAAKNGLNHERAMGTNQILIC